MTTSEIFQLVLGVCAALLFFPALGRFLRLFTVEVDHDEAVLITRFGRLAATLCHPGLYPLLDRLLPWVKVERVSLQRDFQRFRDLPINDARGTSMLVDLWVELRVTEPRKALYEVADWRQSLFNLVQHAAISILGSRDFEQILTDRVEIGELLRRDIGAETQRWGISIEQVFVRSVSLLPEVSRQMFETIAARLERAKANIEEEGRLRVADLEARINLQVAKLVADAKGQYPAAIARTFAQLGQEAAVLAAYQKLYEISLLRPHRTISFAGFADGEMSAAEALMVAPPPLDGTGERKGLRLGGGGEENLLRHASPAITGIESPS